MPAPLPTIDAATLANRLTSGARMWLVHAPGPSSFRAGHIRGAVAFADADHACGVLDPDDAIVVYGGDSTCTASSELVRELRGRGYRRVIWFVGGLEEWAAVGGPVEAAARAAWPGTVPELDDRERRAP